MGRETGGVVNHGRGCRDVLFALLFIGAFIAFLVLSAEGFKKGEPKALITESGEIPKTVSAKLSERVRSQFGKVVGQLRDSWKVILGAASLAVVLAFVWVNVLRVATKQIIYATLIAGILLVTGLSVYMLSLGEDRNNKYLIVCGILGLVFAVVLTCITIGLRKKIALTALMMREACTGLDHNPLILVLAVLSLVLFLGFAAYWLAAFVYLYAVPDENLTKSLYYCVFFFFWMSGVIAGTFKVAVAGGIASWYFSRTAGSMNTVVDNPVSPSLAAYVRAWTLSLGSIALGALLVAIVKFINWVLEKTRRESGSKIVRFIIACIQCCLGSIERMISFVNKYGAVYIAMRGESFCESTKNVYELLKSEGMSLIAVDFISDWVLFVGKIFGAAASAILALAILHARDDHVSGLTISAIIIISYIVFDIFAHTLGMGIDTTFVCYIEDLSRNGAGNLVMSPDTHRELETYAASVQ